MRVIPAIDLRNGKCVRLKQGRVSEQTVYDEHPENIARKFYTAGATRIHVVDLDGAFEGKSRNGESIRRIIDAAPVEIELGGGIRKLDHIRFWLDQGVTQVILGTAAVENSDMVQEAVSQFGAEKIIIGIDTNNGMVATHGWQKTSETRDTEFARQMAEYGVFRFIYTAIHTDGMLTGPAIDDLTRFARSIDAKVTASGGIKDLESLRALQSLEQFGVDSAITGRAIYEGTLDLHEAIRSLRGKE